MKQSVVVSLTFNDSLSAMYVPLILYKLLALAHCMDVNAFKGCINLEPLHPEQ